MAFFICVDLLVGAGLGGSFPGYFPEKSVDLAGACG